MFACCVSLLLFPVPVTESLTIQSSANIESIEIFDLSGSMVVQGENMTSIDLSILSTGVYIVNLHTDGGAIIRKKIYEKMNSGQSKISPFH